MRKIKIGEKVWVQSIPQYSHPDGKPVKVEKAALGLVWVRAKYSRDLVEVLEDDIIFAEPEVLGGEEKAQLVRSWVNPDFIKEFSQFHLELGVFNKLFKKYPSVDFWRNFKPEFQVKSLKWWFGKGKEDIHRIYNEYTLDLSKAKIDTNVTEDKIGEDIKITKKPKSFLDL